MEKNSTKTKKFFKKFGVYILAGCLAVAIVLTLTLSLTKGGSDTNINQEPIVDVDTKPLVFTLPLEGATVLKGYSATDLMYNSTLKQWEAHKNGFVSTYSSLADSLVKAGDIVSAGQKLGEVSSTGANEMAQGDHLHFALSKDGKVVDPASFLELSNK